MNLLDKLPDYLVLGHVSKDVLPGTQGYAPGGTALYSALTAQRLGLQAAIVTAHAEKDQPMLRIAREAGVWIHRISSPKTTTFRNIYDANGRRTQTISAQAASISQEDVPPAWLDAPIVHLAPVAQELTPDVPNAFTNCLLGITPQGWMRSWDGQGTITQSAAPVPTALTNLPSNAFLVLSLEDLAHDLNLLEDYVKLASFVAVTQGPNEAYLYDGGRCHIVPACTAKVEDPTGAGDVFAAALFVCFKETADLIASARFAHAAAALSIGGRGPSAIADRAAIEGRLKVEG